MARILVGAPVAAALMEQIKRETVLLAARGVIPVLALVRIGGREDDRAYERGIVKRAGDAGLTVRHAVLPEDAAHDKVLELIRSLNTESAVHGILLFRPLPAHLDDAEICAAIDPAKDLDGVSPGSLAAVYSGGIAGEAGSAVRGGGFAPCTAEACIALLDHYGIGIEGKRFVVVGRSLVIGRPAAMLLLHRNATVTLCHSRTVNLAAVCREADAVIAASGKRELLGAVHFSAGQTIIDVGIHLRQDGTLAGDVNFAEAEPLAADITPVPGGVGAVTTAVLLSHLVRAARRAGAGI
ncbi:MAG: bifunctional 5,10-methylenetetrahydrofolate dehydrogenase/5,10-methenyltetrahydrofolate cyclohydrolase [Spirochaetaceae bacterium]|jgi:methylenetetrahydrofolate dehydrogenase (NADP+)/methenyltetrahydrofolate cyclohydrolase|nr:bifunctional 5,10-methylenetetrahydrofolate dehydrogenase/5,10-methenyltetrahydrofolate cyclohydrolase [Spirochaetaceae bacterium]